VTLSFRYTTSAPSGTLDEVLFPLSLRVIIMLADPWIKTTRHGDD
jgi:hypothetical protein